MTNKAYVDPATGEWIGEHATRNSEGEVSRTTEWFATEAEAERFRKTGEK